MTRAWLIGACVGTSILIASGLAPPPVHAASRVAQPEGPAGGPADPAPDVMARLERLERALLKPDSTLPDDPDRSLESMLEEILSAARAGSGAPFDAALMRDIRREVEALSDDVERDVKRPLDALRRDVDDLQRSLGGATGSDVSGEIRGLERSLQSISRQLDSIDRRLSALERRR
ncbi:MAG: hypothetical protein H6811_00705 [Phycisphaeraceae bacterium]|nr:hypothetical protein [Phycisphaeraceae bacterium]